ncbi:MAG TPA: AIR carboxylase family protein, partial [Vicinamibacteria bacterium]|nr:AIR carboxylase family protein [Vicinamibacteria bacterium]
MASPKVLIVMGSASDKEVMAEAAEVLRELGIPYELGVYSAHRTPERAAKLASEAAGRVVRVMIAGAGAAAHLAGAIA